MKELLQTNSKVFCRYSCVFCFSVRSAVSCYFQCAKNLSFYLNLYKYLFRLCYKLLALFLGKKGRIPCLPWQENMEAPRGTPCSSGARRKQRATRYLQSWLRLCSVAARQWSLPMAQARLLHTWLHLLSALACHVPSSWNVCSQCCSSTSSSSVTLLHSFFLRGQLPSHRGGNQLFTGCTFETGAETLST